MTSTRLSIPTVFSLLALAGLLNLACAGGDRPATAAADDEPGEVAEAACCEIWGERHDPQTVRLEFGGRMEGGWVGAVVYGDGVVVIDDIAQTTVEPAEVQELLRALEAHDFRAMEELYGAGKAKLRALVRLDAGDYGKMVGRKLEGVGEDPLTPLWEELHTTLRPRLGDDSVRPGSLEEAVGMIVDGTLSPRTLHLTLLHRDPSGEAPGDAEGRILRIHDGWLEAETLEENPDRPRPTRRAGTLDTIRGVAELVAEVGAWDLPPNIHADEHTQLTLEVLHHRRTVLAREFARRDSAAQAAERERLGRLVADLLVIQREMVTGTGGN